MKIYQHKTDIMTVFSKKYCFKSAKESSVTSLFHRLQWSTSTADESNAQEMQRAI